jgi:diacylglycerol kinase family enzyme
VSAPSGFLVVANGNAGSAERAEVDTALGILAEAAPVRLRPTASPDDVDAVLDGVDDRPTVVAGGDGSLHLVVARLRARRQSAAPVGLVPLGTGNDFARGAGVPLDPADAAHRIVDGRPRPIDVLVDDDGGIVVNAVHAGVGAVAADRAEGMKDRLGPLAYPVGAVLAAVRADGWRLDVTVDGTPLPLPGDRVLMVGVGNGPSIGGGTPLCPDAEPDDGALDVVVACATGPAARAAFGRALRSGRHVERDDVVAVRGREVRITGDAVGYDADGELDENVTDRTYRVEPAAWSLVS